MYLKSLEVHGFKSFANKILFEFHDGITGIVGPNGSGKSNVGDAVRWVLGEQSAKQLRGAKMEDIIFSGTELRKPLGFAYVAITLDNSDHKLPIDYDQVTVARRVYRSGESEYLINGSSCRLRDVQDLFLDTGIGKEGYSIIGQGQIDRIISGKPEEKRELFDEAAGIVKFKKRKATAEKNLEAEQQNLIRINDILEEREKQLKPLMKQSETAKEYLKLRDELKLNEVNLFLIDYNQLTSQQTQIDEKISIVDNDLTNTTKSFENTKEEYERLELLIEEKTGLIEAERGKLSESKLKKEKLEGDLKVLNEQIHAAKLSNAHLHERSKVIKSELKEKDEQKNEYVLKKEEIDEKLDLLDDLQTGEQNKLNEIIKNINNYNKEVENCHSHIIEILNENSNIKTKMQRYETMLEQNNIKKVELNQKLLKSKSDEAEQDDIIESLNNSYLKVSDEINLLNSANENINNASKELQDNINTMSFRLNDQQQSFHREKSKLDALKNITERYEGYGNSIKKVMERKNTVNGIIGVVADIIKVKPEYEIAVEIALGGNIQNIVTDNDKTAKELIEYLKYNKFGRATFLPLTNMTNKSSFHNESALKEAGVIGLGSTLVEAESRFNSLIEHLLGRIIVVDNIDNAMKLSKKYNYTLRIVTKDGELLSPGGSMSGGAYKNTSNLLSRRREIEDFENTILEIEKSINSLKEDIEKEKSSRQNLREELEINKQKLQELYLKQNSAKLNLEQAKQKVLESKTSYNAYLNESKEIDVQIKDLNANINELKKSLSENEDLSKNSESRISELNGLIESESIKEKEASAKTNNINLDFSNLEQNNNFILENIKRIKSEIDKLNLELDNLTKNINETYQLVEEKKHDKTEIEIIIEEEKEIAEKAQNLLNIFLADKEEISKNHKDFFIKREEQSKLINELDKEKFRLFNQKEKISEQIDTSISYMWDEYELTYSNAMNFLDETLTNVSVIKKRVSELKSGIKGLGDVNVNAIEDYKNIVESYEFLKEQRDDLVKAEETLKSIISELDTEMRIQFEEKFKEIQVQFDIVFKELFGGGKGSLELIEDEDILDAGIRIIAQPPGKKLQNMMQLSGGEKALTAISLLFAIQKLKPSPFCLLDEIEAALDDSNVKRFAKYLDKLTKDTQFIIITHRRGTMASADILYGVTMQEKGVSTLVSVNLIESELK